MSKSKNKAKKGFPFRRRDPAAAVEAKNTKVALVETGQTVAAVSELVRDESKARAVIAALETELKLIGSLFWEPGSPEWPMGSLYEAIADRIEQLEEGDDMEVTATSPTLASAFLSVLHDTVENGAIGRTPIAEREDVIEAVAQHKKLSAREAAHDIHQMKMASGLAAASSPLILHSIQAAL